jgi:hypothetical protein
MLGQVHTHLLIDYSLEDGSKKRSRAYYFVGEDSDPLSSISVYVTLHCSDSELTGFKGPSEPK